ncbi:MAG: ribulose-phosphate 3-epimerase [Spirochaetia bacterium]|nr:ribulose-phosphate 3-epimerase [Spirochaetia bacterium]MBR5017711.1 ribulose-phosphate 3-epimerase [Spirochaetia bacterium]
MNRKCKISASLMCADPYLFQESLKTLQDAGIDYLHMDVMDGHFVQNYGISIDFCKKIRQHTNIPFDFHLMVEEPQKLIPGLELRENDIVSIHYESTYYIKETLDMLKQYKSKLFVALRPETPIIILDTILDYIDGVNFLTVNPGFAGQKMVTGTARKAQNLIPYLKARGKENLDFEVDGNMSYENIALFKEIGANIFVLGTSSVFNDDMKNSLQKVQQLLIN